MTQPSTNRSDGRNVETVGIVGAGRVGQWFVTKLVRESYDVVVSDVDPEAVADAVDRGAAAAEHAADATARADVVVLALPTREAVETAMEGADGVLDALEPGQAVVDTGTTTPDLDVHYHGRCRERDAGYVDCGLTRHGPGRAEGDEPAYTLFVGGERDDYESVRPVVDALAYTHEFFEGVGNGHVVKLGVALRASIRATMAAEVCEFLSHNGVDPDQVVDLLEWEIPSVYVDPPSVPTRGFERARETDDGETEPRGVRVDDAGERARLRTSAWAKDTAYALDVAHSSNSYAPLLTAAHQTRLLAENYGAALTDRDLSFGDEEWGPFHLRSLYRALSRPQEEWRRLGR
ncbi:NAD(P)-dependent oxidoreductase [Halomarina rubra]|uniref:NAD(P)-dependent oxidoreductase n=1 Tax=Halomarina rubra TaxID=2071873 RepID=A0ABD6AY77_9EURY|nr:NAD(P)-binding domain-containing protein [Halomarina rubra]